MAITKDLEIKINGDKAAFNEDFYVYQNDRGIDLNIKVSMPKIQIGTRSTSLLSDLEDALASVRILKPDGEVISREKVPIDNDRIKFTIDKSLTDELNEIGFYKLQFHIFDQLDNRITIPPVQFEVKALIGLFQN